MVEVYKPQESQEINEILSTPSELQTLNEDINTHLKKTMEAYLETNITINGVKINFSDSKNNKELIQDITNPSLFTLQFDTIFSGLNIQDDATLQTQIKFEVIMKNNNYYLVFKKNESRFAKDVVFDPMASTLTYKDVVYDIIIPTEKTKTTDIRIEANPTKTEKRIIEKIENQQFTSLNNITEKAEFENTQLTGLNNIILGKEVTKTQDGYIRQIAIYDIKRNLYRPIADIVFDKKGNLDVTKTNRTPKTTILGQEIEGEMGISNNILQFRFKQNDITKLEKRISEHRTKLISYIDKTRIAPGTKFSEFNKTNKERARHIGKEKFLFETTKLHIDIIQDTYILTSTREKEQNIKFGFEYNTNPTEDKVFIKNIIGEKVIPKITTNRYGEIQNVEGGFTITIDKNNIYSVFEHEGELRIVKIKNAEKNIPTSQPEITGGGKTLLSKNLLHHEENSISYYEETGKKITTLPVQRNKNNERIIQPHSKNIDTNNLINLDDFNSTYEKVNISKEEMRTSFHKLMEKEKINLSERPVIKVFNTTTKKYEYHTVQQRRSGGEITIEKDQKLYEITEKITNIMKTKIEIMEKIENIQLRLHNKGERETRFEGAIGGGRGLEKSSLSIENKLAFLSGDSNTLTQKILRDRGDATEITYTIKGRSSIGMNIKDPKAVKLENTWFLNRKIQPTIDIQRYKVNLETGRVYKLHFNAIEK